MSLPVGAVPTVRDMFVYGMSLCSFITCPRRKGQYFGPKIKSSCAPKQEENGPESRSKNRFSQNKTEGYKTMGDFPSSTRCGDLGC